MVSKISGRVTYANGLAAPDVEVRVFDQDAPGKGDDDLTLTPGLSDAHGAFQVRFDPGRYMDFVSLPFLGLSRPSESGQASGPRFPDLLDLLTPYLQFRYTINGQPSIHKTAIVPFQNEYHLPEALPIHFVPSQNAFKFPNLFPGFNLPFSVPFLPSTKKITGDYGLCGGMSAAACDFILSGRSIPEVDRVPRNGTRFYRYLFRRAMDSFAMGESILKFARWMALPDDGPNGTWRLTLAEYNNLRAALEQQRLAPIGLVITRGSSLQEISRSVWGNHQVLAYACTDHPDGSADIHVYDPNSPGRDSARIHVTPVQVGEGPEGPLMGVKCQPIDVSIYPQQVRGFFQMPYEPLEPPDRLV